MITLSKVKRVTIKGLERIIQVLEYGPKTAMEVSPFGEDGCPLPEMTAIYATTGTNGEQIILGYINSNQMAQTGEKRLYSLKEDGSLAAWAWLKNDGTIELNGNTDNVVRYQPLNSGLQQHRIDVNVELQKIAVAIASLGGSYTAMTVGMDINAAKVDEIKCP